MKSFLFCLALLFGSMSLFPSQAFVSKADSKQSATFFAKILQPDVYFYSSSYVDEDSMLFEIPKTFFVQLLNEENDFYYAKYLDLYGYVKKSEVVPMDGTPTNPFASASFRNFSPVSLSVFERPIIGAKAVGKIDSMQENVTYYGKIVGDEYISSSTRTWLYCLAKDENGSPVHGFAFSYYCDSFIQPGTNFESFPEITGPLEFVVSSPQAGLSDTMIAIIILAICLPCLVILYFLLSPAKRKKSTEKSKSRSFKRGKDYYEFNEDDL